MIIYPAMDLMGGKVVRLKQGQFDQLTTYTDDPAQALRAFANAGAKWAHVVDLDGAREGRPMQHELIAELAGLSPLRLQVAGGFREQGHLARMFDAGVERIVLGSLAIKQPHIVRSWIDVFGQNRIALSLDVKIIAGVPMVRISGWAEKTGRSLLEVASNFPSARHLLVTDIARDGMLAGPNFALYEEVVLQLPQVRVQASGGVASLEDLGRLRTDGAIIGKALWDGRISLEEACGLDHS